MRTLGAAVHYGPGHPQLPPAVVMNALRTILTCSALSPLLPLRWPSSPPSPLCSHHLITTPLPFSVIYIITPLPFPSSPLPALSPPPHFSCPRLLLYSHQLFNYRSIIFIITSVTIIIVPITISMSFSTLLQCKTLATFEKAITYETLQHLNKC